MELPFDQLLSTLTTSADAASGWSACCDALDGAAPSTIWADLRKLDAARDVAACAGWLAEQLADAAEFLHEVDAGAPRGVAVWLDPQALADDEGWCLEIGATSECDPAEDTLDWTERCPWVGDFHLVDGLVEAERAWLMPRNADVRDLAEYASFLFYGGLILRHALTGAGLGGPWLVAWGFVEGDQGLLARGDGADVTPLALLG